MAEPAGIACPECGAPTGPSDSYCPSCRTDLRGLGWDSDTFPGGTNIKELDAETGRVIDGRYRIISKLGEGGMGTVYKVEHVRMGKIMALKLLRPEVAVRRHAAERFRREAQSVSKLDHPNVITVFDSGASEQEALYLVMEYVPGRDLAQVLRDEGSLPERRALGITVQVLRALAHAHSAGIIHRDIKCANIMLVRDAQDRVKVLDFGLAKLVAGPHAAAQPGQSQITLGAELVGTPNCMSPEQARGLELDPRSDLYSAAAVLFELLAGRGPFVGSPFEIVSQHLVAEPPALAKIAPDRAFSAAVEAIVKKGLAKKPADRYASADEMCAALNGVLGGAVSAKSSESPLAIARREDWDAFERSFRRRRAAVNVSVMLAVVLGLGAAIVMAGRAPREGTSVRAALEEREPNDLPSQANYLEPGKPIIGRIGMRASESVSDRDMFEFFVPEKSALALEVTGVRGINLVVEIFSAPQPGSSEAPIVAAVDDGAVSEDERLSDLVLSKGRYFIRLMDRRRLDEPDGPPRENDEDYYTLKVRLDPLRPYQEIEPNNEPREAMPVTTATPLLGKAGIASVVEIKRIGPAPWPPWSVDQYRLQGIDAAHTACAVMGGLKFASMRLSVIGGRPLKVLGAAAKIGERSGGVICAKGQDPLIFEVRLESGTTHEATYPIAFIADQPGGFDGLIALAGYLEKEGRAEEAKSLLEKALSTLPRAPDAQRARDLIR